jgi:hypothetical protein
LNLDGLPPSYPAANPPRISSLYEANTEIHLVGDMSKPTDWLESFYSWIRDAEALGMNMIVEDVK